MGKRIIQRARGHGGPRYRARKRAFRFKIGYPSKDGKATVLKLINSGGHSAPIARLKIGNDIFYNIAGKNIYEGQEIEIGGQAKEGNIVKLKDIATGTPIYNIEIRKGDGGKLIRTGGNSAYVSKKSKGTVTLMLPSKKEKDLDENCRATIGVAAGHGRLEKPLFKAGKNFYIMKVKNKLWPRTSAVKMNVIDHPFGSGRGKNVSHGKKGKIPRKNAPIGAKVGTLRPRRTGRRKR